MAGLTATRPPNEAPAGMTPNPGGPLGAGSLATRLGPMTMPADTIATAGLANQQAAQAAALKRAQAAAPGADYTNTKLGG